MPVAARTGRGSIALRGAPTVVAAATVTDEKAPDEAGPGGTSRGGRGGRSGRRGKDAGAGVVVEAKATAEPASASRAGRGRVATPTRWRLSRRKQQIGPTTRSKAEDASQAFAIKHKGGLSRGLQTGSATLATFLCRSASADVIQWFKAEPHHRYAALRLPVLADLATRKLTWFSGRMSRGFLYQQHLNQIVRDVIAPGVNTAS